MNILFLTKHFETGGITTYLLTLGAGLVEQGHKVVIVSSGGNCVDLAKEKGIQHITVKATGVKSILNPLMWLALPKLKQIVKEHDIDIVHAQTRVTQVLASVLQHKLGVPFVSTCHGFFKPHFWRTKFPCWGRKIIAISRPVEEHLTKDFLLPGQDVALVPNGIDLKKFRPADEGRCKELRAQWNLLHVPVVGIIARLSTVKGHKYLIKAMQLVRQKHPQVKCLIVGEGSLESSLKRQVKDLDLEDVVQFYKVVNNTHELLPLFDVFALPSLSEGLGLSVMEAQASALPVVVSNVGGLPDLVENDKTGLLVTPENVTGLSKAISSLLDDEDKAKKLGRQARQFIEQRFASSIMVEKTLAVYKEVVDS